MHPALAKSSGVWAAKPAPLTFFDATIHMAPAVVMRGLPEAVEYYKLLLAELNERIENKVAAIEGERHRIYWDGMPIWGKLRDLAALFMSLSTNIVASTYCNSWIFDAFDPAQPFESMARAYTELFIVRDESYKEAYMTNGSRASRSMESSSTTRKRVPTIPTAVTACSEAEPNASTSRRS